VFVQELDVPSIKQEAPTSTDTLAPDVQVLVINLARTQVFIDYIPDHKLPDDKVEVEQITCRSKNYASVEDRLYQRGASSGILLKCITPEEGQKILEEIHSGCCGNHAASRTLVSKAFRSGYYWPTALKDAEELVRHCTGYQFFAKQAHVPAHNLICIPPSWPFSCWGLTRWVLSNAL
jgi:hypothetical protein